ncbi:MAG TPA: DUF6468 domain-containing protein [Caulobacteraceae bacterium]|nr:DUF6468 domain-containing protein [Caulobacteraceae bacterium]
MSPISMTLDLLLAALLLVTLGFGLRLERRLKALQASQATFAAAVADLDRAAARAETGLADLRGAMDEAVGLLAGRIEKARELAARLETLTAGGAAIAERSPATAQRSALDRVWTRPAAAAPRRAPEPAPREAPLTLGREEALTPRRPAAALGAAPSPRSRALVDDELFDGPGLRRAAGGRL